MTDLATAAEHMFADIVRDNGTDIDAIRDEICERSHDAADSACIYYSACEDIISRYETDSRADTDSADDMGATYKPSEYLNAMRDYAFFIAWSIIEAEAFALADTLESAFDTLAEIVNNPADRRMPADGMPADAMRLSADCPHGWAPHNFENDEGTCFWLSRQLDGCNAVAMPVAGIWLSYTWE